MLGTRWGVLWSEAARSSAATFASLRGIIEQASDACDRLRGGGAWAAPAAGLMLHSVRKAANRVH